ncbi:nuclear transport factor 2 family protein [Altererythrobacter arenosus]|uniref:Nuclear transport factor 2 family protein n=1 Tax=Altererythrobacter arenosus TaxID=3032592 RepID=A0ABY8FPE9_9SPHN|nr:nuclear transport factor 2 family protein [Altererythrobacter sp. CAU 1644]WFL76883.1 nuclear transport factor 2 family protein [Altererythrobacter sp. CAU 1644]
MSNIAAEIETLEHRFMRAWMRREAGEIRKLAARDFMLIVASEPAQLLDRPSFVEAMAGPLSCTGFRFHEVCVRKHGRAAWFTARAELELRIDRRDWTGNFWVSDLWLKGRVKRGWKMVERSLARTDGDEQLPGSLRQLQLWH